MQLMLVLQKLDSLFPIWQPRLRATLLDFLYFSGLPLTNDSFYRNSLALRASWRSASSFAIAPAFSSRVLLYCASVLRPTPDPAPGYVDS